MSKSVPTVMTSVRMQTGLHYALRQIADQRRVSMHALLLEGARLAAARHQETVHAEESPDAEKSTSPRST